MAPTPPASSPKKKSRKKNKKHAPLLTNSAASPASASASAPSSVASAASASSSPSIGSKSPVAAAAASASTSGSLSPSKRMKVQVPPPLMISSAADALVAQVTLAVPPLASDLEVLIPFVTPRFQLHVDSKVALQTQNAMVASNMNHLELSSWTKAVHEELDLEQNTKEIQKSSFLELFHGLSSLRHGEAFRATERILEQVFVFFESVHKNQWKELGIACLPLLAGTVQQKFVAAVSMLCTASTSEDSTEAQLNKLRISAPQLEQALLALLLAITALFDQQCAYNWVPGSPSAKTTTPKTPTSPKKLTAKEEIKQHVVKLCTKLKASVEESVGQFLQQTDAETSSELALNSFWQFIEPNEFEKLPWIVLIDDKKWPKGRLASPRGLKVESVSSGSPPKLMSHEQAVVDVAASQPNSQDAATSIGSFASSSAASGSGAPVLSFCFSSMYPETCQIAIQEKHGSSFFYFLQKSDFSRFGASMMYDTLVQHTTDGLLEEETFLEAIEELTSLVHQQELMQDAPFLDQMMEFFKLFVPVVEENKMKREQQHPEVAGSFLGDQEDETPLGRVDAFELAAAMSLFVNGTKSEKLVCAFHYFDVDNKGFLHVEQLWRFLRSVLIGLLFIAPPMLNAPRSPHRTAPPSPPKSMLDPISFSSSATASLGARIVKIVDLAQQEVVQKVKQAMEARGEKIVTFEEFGTWYNSGGYETMSWLELLDLKKWCFLSDRFRMEELNTNAVEMFVTPSSYYSANHIHVASNTPTVTTGDGALNIYSNSPRSGLFSSPAAIKSPRRGEKSPRNRTRSGSTSSVGSGIVTTRLPAICLKDEIVLEFELPPFEETAADDIPGSGGRRSGLSFEEVALPLTTLAFHNGDLIHFAEFQRIVQLDQISFYRVFDTFEPFVEDSMEKDTFDTCMAGLLPQLFDGSLTRLTAREVKYAMDTLSRLFFAFNRAGTGKVDVLEFVCGFFLFCKGSKSEKLAFAFKLFDTDGDGNLSRREVWRFLRCFLTVLVVFGNGSDLSGEAIGSVVDTASIEIADIIFDAIRQENNALYHQRVPPSINSLRNGRLVWISFEEFARWYSTYGFQLLAWIELLDTKKWPTVTKSVADAILRYDSCQQALLDAASTGPNLTHKKKTGHGSDSVSSRGEEHRNSSLEGNYPSSTPTVTFLGNDEGERNTTEAEKPTNANSGAPSKNANHGELSKRVPRDLNTVALQFKLTSYDNTSLRIRLKDVAIIYTIAEKLQLSSMKVDSLYHAFAKYAKGKMLSKVGFLKTVRHLVPKESLTNEDQEFLSFHLLRLFTLFEEESVMGEEDLDDEAEDDNRDDHPRAAPQNPENLLLHKSSSVPLVHLVAGMSLFCGFSKSAKLETLFRLFRSGNGEPGTHSVTRRLLFEMFKSVLTVLFAFSSFAATKSHTNDTLTTETWNCLSVAQKVAASLLSKVFCESKCQQRDAISFKEFADWYGNGGYLHCPWLELLDLTKWPATQAFEATKQERPLMYAFDMLEEGSLLFYTESDIATYLFMLRSTKLSEVTVTKLYDALLDYSKHSLGQEKSNTSSMSGFNSKPMDPTASYTNVDEDEGAYLVITRQSFYDCIRSLVPQDQVTMSEKAQQTCSKLLSRLFNVFDRKRCGQVNALELACGLSIVGEGTKSQKLSMAFEFIVKLRQKRQRMLQQYQGDSSMGGGGGMSIYTKRRPKVEHSKLPLTVVFVYLRAFLLALMALSDGTYRLGLEQIMYDAEEFIQEALGDLRTEISVNGNDLVSRRGGISFEDFGEWYNAGGFRLISWVELLDVSKWQQQHDFLNTSSAKCGPAYSTRPGVQPPQKGVRTSNVELDALPNEVVTTKKKQLRHSDIVAANYEFKNKQKTSSPSARDADPSQIPSLTSDGPLMVYAIGNGAAELQFYNDHIGRFKNFLQDTNAHKLTSWQLQINIQSLVIARERKHGLAVVQLGTLFNAVQSSFGSSALSEESAEILDAFLRVFLFDELHFGRDDRVNDDDEEEVKEEEHNEPQDLVEVKAAICGLFMMVDGPLSEKLECGCSLVEHETPQQAGNTADEVQVTSLRDVLSFFLMAFYAIGSSWSNDVVRNSSQIGATRVVNEFLSSTFSSSTPQPPPLQQQATSPTQASSPRKVRAQRIALASTSPLVSLTAFCDWFSEDGHRSLPWLELAELEHWPALMDVYDSQARTQL